MVRARERALSAHPSYRCRMDGNRNAERNTIRNVAMPFHIRIQFAYMGAIRVPQRRWTIEKRKQLRNANTLGDCVTQYRKPKTDVELTKETWKSEERRKNSRLKLRATIQTMDHLQLVRK